MSLLLLGLKFASIVRQILNETVYLFASLSDSSQQGGNVGRVAPRTLPKFGFNLCMTQFLT